MSFLNTGHKLNIDIGTYCNLKCPNCMRTSITKDYNRRNNTNLSQHPYLNTSSITLENIEKWVPIKFLTDRVTYVDFCGALAEPTLNPQCIDLIEYFSPHVSVISLSTNGDTKTVNWWKKLGKISDNLVVRFYLDSFKPGNSLYRQSNSFRIIENIKAYTLSGGKAILCNLVFKHNQDEIEDFKRFAKELNCNYRMMVAREFTTNDYTSYEVEHNGKIYLLEKNTLIPSNVPYRIALNSSNPAEYCSLIHEKMIRIFSNGLVMPCCHIEGQLFETYEAFFLDETNTKPNLSRHPQFVKDFASKIELQGGIKTISLKYNSIEQIFNSKFYKTYLPLSWKLKSNEICQNCINGTRLDIKDQNEYNNPEIIDIPKAG